MCDFHMRFRRLFWHKIIGHRIKQWMPDGLHGYCICGDWFAKTTMGLVKIHVKKQKGDNVK